jgi:WD40 repeat protein
MAWAPRSADPDDAAASEGRDDRQPAPDPSGGHLAAPVRDVTYIGTRPGGPARPSAASVGSAPTPPADPAPRLVARLNDHASPVPSVGFAHDASCLLTGGMDREVHVWDCSTWEIVRRLTGLDETTWCLAVSPSEPLVAAGGGDEALRVWDWSAGRIEVFKDADETGLCALAFSRDGAWMASGRPDGDVLIWDTQSWAVAGCLSRHGGQVKSVAFSADGLHLVSGSWDGTARVWDLARELELASVRTGGQCVAAVAFGDGGSTVVFASDAAYLWDWSAPQPRCSFGREAGSIQALAVAPSRHCIAGGGSGMTVGLWRASDGRDLTPATGNNAVIHSVSFAPDGALLAAGDDSGEVVVWEI